MSSAMPAARRSNVVANVLVLAGAAWLLGSGTELGAERLLPEAAKATASDGTLAALEARAAREPGAAAVARLASAYLDRGQPGLASAVIERASAAVRGSPEIAHLHARALFHRGRVAEALAIASAVEETCDPAAPQPARCPAWLAAKATRHRAFLAELAAARIEDPARDPEGVRAAYERSTREVRLVAMR